jgi:hypothetical protein
LNQRTGLMVIVGAVLMIQGFGSALAQTVWSSDWGLLAVAERHVPLPTWTGVVLGTVGIALVIGGLFAARRRGAGSHGR